MLAEVARQGLRVEQAARRLGDDDLAAVRRGCDPRGPVDVHSDVAVGRQERLAGVKPHADPDWNSTKRRLRRDGRRDGVGRAGECDEERVSLRVDLDAVVPRDRIANHAPVPGEELGVRRAVLLKQPRRCFDVGEEKRDGAGWKTLGFHCAIISHADGTPTNLALQTAWSASRPDQRTAEGAAGRCGTGAEPLWNAAVRKDGNWQQRMLTMAVFGRLNSSCLPTRPASCCVPQVLYWYSKGLPRISTKNQVTIPVAVLEEAGLHAGDQVVVEALEEGELRVRRGTLSFERAFGALTGTYPRDYLKRLDREDTER
jgi:AbrB family looped-hinge helix DNA binding protein